jgi:hypothetical protein
MRLAGRIKGLAVPAVVSLLTTARESNVTLDELIDILSEVEG